MLRIRRNWVRMVNLGILFAFSTIIILLRFLKPAAEGMGTHRQLIPLPCLFKTLLGVPCPSCGLTTSLSFLAHGRIIESFKVHPLGPILGTLFIIIIVQSLWGVVRNREWWLTMKKSWFQNLVLCGIGFYLGIWLIRLIT